MCDYGFLLNALLLLVMKYLCYQHIKEELKRKLSKKVLGVL